MLSGGVLSQEEVREALADNPNSGYSNIDADDVPENDTFADVDMDDKDESGSVFDGAQDEWVDNPKEWITTKNGTHIPVKAGQSKENAVTDFTKNNRNTDSTFKYTIFRLKGSHFDSSIVVKTGSSDYEEAKKEGLEEIGGANTMVDAQKESKKYQDIFFEEAKSKQDKSNTQNKISSVVVDDKELRNAEKRISRLNHEELIVFDKDGKKVSLNDNDDYELVGNNHRVDISEEQLRKINGKILTHNHPNGNVFSSADLFSGFGKAQVAELRAVTPNGTVYSLRHLENANIKKLLPEYQQTEHKAERLFKEKIDREFRSGIISAEEKKKALYDDFNKYCNEKLLTMFRNKSKDFGFEFKEYKQDD